MPEYRYFDRGRRLLHYTEAANRAAIALGESIPFPPRKGVLVRFAFFLWLTLRLGRKSKPVPPLPPNPNYVWWGGVHLPMADAVGHFVVIGGIGSGKSLILDTLMESAFRHFGPGKDQRAFIFDAKRELFSKLTNLNLPVPIILADPFDSRGSAWDVAADITDAAGAHQLAACLVPASKNETDRFWTYSTRNILGGIIENFAVLTPGKWNLRDVLLAMRSRNRISQILRARVETAHLWDEATQDEKTCSNLLASFNAQLQRYETVAALWHNCPRKFSLKEWIHSDSVLLIRGHPKFSASLQPIHQVMLDLLADLILSEPDSRTRRTWIFLDEARDLGNVAKLPRLANLSRSKGGVLALGLQSVEGLYDAYGTENVANELLGQMRHVTFLRGNSPTTAAFAERYFGSVEWLVERITYSHSTSAKGESTRGSSVDHQRRQNPTILASEIMDIAPPSEKQPVVLFNDIPAIGSFKVAIPLQEFLTHLRPANPTVPNVVECESKQQNLVEWKASDVKRLKLPSQVLRLPPTQVDLALAQLETLAQLDNPKSS